MNTRRLALVAAPAAAFGIAVAVLSARAPAGATRPPLAGPPATLRATGLYADWDERRVADGNLPYAPQYPLWSDGARKRRWIRIPSGAAIDAARPDAWVFPVGTRLWKEFSLGGRRVETRYMERTASGWVFASYAWSADQREAVLAPAGGLAAVAEIAPGVAHAIPGQGECRACHDAASPVLGFSALQLSP
ncbi:MAG TPA: hypothetical protein VFU21_30720, partial [Kofleriaceae bacterium]|nr:hypothetical protein [Kofleriaceae bacterium]